MIPQDEWAMVALVVRANEATEYVFSSAEGGLAQATYSWTHTEQTVGDLNIGWVDCCGGGRYFSGVIDEVRVYDRALSDAEIVELVAGPSGPGQARQPQPEHEATDVSRDTVLAWQPGEFAAEHSVYFGTGPVDVNDATLDVPLGVLISAAQDTTSTDPGRLDFDQTYHWRVDEVNSPPDATVYRGAVWSFTTVAAISIDDMERYKDEELLEPWATWVDGFGDASNGGQRDLRE